MKIPFLYAVRKFDGDNVPPQDNPIVKWIVYLALWGYHTENTQWMCDDKIGNYPLVPVLDLVDSEWEFDNERDALVKMQELWKNAGF